MLSVPYRPNTSRSRTAGHELHDMQPREPVQELDRGRVSRASADESMRAERSERTERTDTPERSRRQDQSAAQQARDAIANAAGEREFVDVHVYGSKAALCFSADTTGGGSPTVRIEGAAALGGRRYDWGNKISFQLTSRELPQALAVLLGWAPALVLRNHGPQADKGLKAEIQGPNVFMGVWQGKRAHACPITAPDAFAVTDLMLRQLRHASPWLSSESLLELTRSLAERMATSTSRSA
jgi:hypothetical protein